MSSLSEVLEGVQPPVKPLHLFQLLERLCEAGDGSRHASRHRQLLQLQELEQDTEGALVMADLAATVAGVGRKLEPVCPEVAVVLLTLAGATEEGTERELAKLCAEFGRDHRRELERRN